MRGVPALVWFLRVVLAVADVFSAQAAVFNTAHQFELPDRNASLKDEQRQTDPPALGRRHPDHRHSSERYPEGDRVRQSGASWLRGHLEMSDLFRSNLSRGPGTLHRFCCVSGKVEHLAHDCRKV